MTWTYTTLSSPATEPVPVAKLQDMGRAGWEVVGVVPKDDDDVFILKRPFVSGRDTPTDDGKPKRRVIVVKRERKFIPTTVQLFQGRLYQPNFLEYLAAEDREAATENAIKYAASNKLWFDKEHHSLVDPKSLIGGPPPA